MNQVVLQQLKAFVERAVRPVRAGVAGKRRMREELLDHLTTIYEAEVQKLGNEEAALEQSKRRFGDPGDLTKELRRSVSRLDFVEYVLDSQRYRPGEPVLHLAVRHLLFSFAAMAGALLLMLPIIWLRGRMGEIGLIIHIVLVMSCVIAAFSFSFMLLVDQMGRIVYARGSQRPVRAMILSCLASLTVVPVITFLMYWGLMGSLTSGLTGFIRGCAAAPAAPLLFFLIARQMKEEMLHEMEWAAIEIEE